MSTEEEVREYIEERVKWGIEDGRKESAIEIASKLLSFGTPINIIVESTGLSEEEVKNLH